MVRRLFVLALIVATAACAGAPAAAQDDRPKITRVEFAGLERTGVAYAEGIVRIKVGEPLDTRSLDDAVAGLLRTGRFWTASYTTEEESGGVAVIFEVRERPVIQAVRFEGNEKLSEHTLRGLVDIEVGSLVDRFAVRQGQDTIAAGYRERGYGDVVVTVDEEELQAGGLLLYRIKEGVRVRIREIRFEGNTAFSESALGRQIETKTAFWFIRTGAFDEDQVERDVIQLRNYYRDEGFLDARVSYRRELDENREDLVLVFTIVEGTRYVIEEVTLEGHTAFSERELRELIVSEPGRFVRRIDLDSDVRAIRDRYGEFGYIYATVQELVVFSDEPGLVRVTIRIVEGEQYRVGKVAVRGNTRTKDKVVRRTLNLYPPDDLWNLQAARDAERELRESGLFDSARVFPVGDTPGVRDVIMDVQEAEKAGDFVFGAGVTSNSGVVGSLVLDLKNFDLFDTPRSFEELLRFRSFFGAGQHLRLELQPGTDVNRFRIDFTEPYFLDKPVSLTVSGYLYTRGRDAYDERRAGTTISLGKRFVRGPLVGWAGEMAFRVEGVTIDELDLFASREIRDSEGLNLLTSAKLTLVRDRTDNRFIPTAGDRLRFSYEQAGVFGGDYTFGKFTGGYTWHKTVGIDRLNRKSVLSLRGEVGAIVGDAPVFERFYAGGIGSIRGFAFRGVGPRDGLDDNNVGGDYLVLLGANYTYPLIGESIRGVLFVDTGMVDSGVRASIGAGVQLTLNIFGPVPLEFNVGVPVLKETDDDTQAFSFYIGTTF